MEVLESAINISRRRKVVDVFLEALGSASLFDMGFDGLKMLGSWFKLPA